MRSKAKNIRDFTARLAAEGRSAGTIEKYRRDVRAFVVWLDDLELEEAAGWRDYLLKKG